MLENKKDDIFLSRWINGELSPEELNEFQSHPEYEYYAKIMAGADALDLAEYDMNTALANIKSNRNTTSVNKSKPVIKLWPYAAVAASIVVILGLFLFSSDDSFTTNYGEQLAVTLPDGSEMILNAKSEASFDKKNWNTDRTVLLNGEAYFKVKKGSKFTVTTENGNVSVLGTEFNVQSQTSFFEAVCYEGKVSVTSGQDNTILTAGKAYRNIKNTAPEHWTFVTQEPSWINNTSSFRSIPLKYVFSELEEQYNINIETKDIDTSTIYTGTFPNNDIEVALKTVFSTLGLQYKLSQDGKTVVLEN
ncbi:FecR family protein [Aquimarina sp. 2201CG14-23]|uniref:FecR family protein n=1 Tax=Aquimarina mycalae TaxID=3040073 RepID=UPI002478283D|nr:FecR family protein [Aquimarina sp. 2201CG14-23]MDH7444268.1 FecR family protein [Aquimarina sp. 2201CG14-23]